MFNETINAGTLQLIHSFNATPKACDYCHPDGTESCNKETGQCICKPYVMGYTCDTCEDGYYGAPSNCQGQSNLYNYLTNSSTYHVMFTHIQHVIAIQKEVLLVTRKLDNVNVMQDSQDTSVMHVKIILNISQIAEVYSTQTLFFLKAAKCQFLETTM